MKMLYVLEPISLEQPFQKAVIGTLLDVCWSLEAQVSPHFFQQKDQFSRIGNTSVTFGFQTFSIQI